MWNVPRAFPAFISHRRNVAKFAGVGSPTDTLSLSFAHEDATAARIKEAAHACSEEFTTSNNTHHKRERNSLAKPR